MSGSQGGEGRVCAGERHANDSGDGAIRRAVGKGNEAGPCGKGEGCQDALEKPTRGPRDLHMATERPLVERVCLGDVHADEACAALKAHLQLRELLHLEPALRRPGLLW